MAVNRNTNVDMQLITNCLQPVSYPLPSAGRQLLSFLHTLFRPVLQTNL